MHMPSHQQPSWTNGGEVVGLPMQQNHSDCSGVAQHALVLGPSDHVESDPTETGFLAQPVNTAFNQIPHRNLTNLNLHAWLLEPHHSRSRVFSEAVAQELGQSEPFLFYKLVPH